VLKGGDRRFAKDNLKELLYAPNSKYRYSHLTGHFEDV
jgi:hypothetical protein